MGLAVCSRLVHAGHKVIASDKRPERRADAQSAGAHWATDARAVASSGADVLVTVLPGPSELIRVISDTVPALRAGTAWIDMTSCSPVVGAELRARVGAVGVECLDVPLGGGVSAAGSGSLQLFVGGPADTVERHRDLLEALGTVEHVGDHGAGYTAKLLVNLLWFGQAVAAGEAMLLARRAGIDLDRLREVLGRSAAASEFIRRDLAGLLDGEYRATFGLDRCSEELDAITSLAASLEVPFELSTCVRDSYARALERFGPVDGELLPIALLEERAGIPLRRGSTGGG
jgi:3-hydroxyisobutyrate dehydrogenase